MKNGNYSHGLFALAAGLFLTVAPARTGAAQTAPPAKTQQEIPIVAGAPQRTILSEVYSGRVRRVVDGRTLVIDQDGRDRTIRLFGVQPPDKSRAGAAKKFLADTVKDRTVRVEARSRDAKGVVEAVVFVVPVAQPRTALRPLDPTGTSSDLPRGADSSPSTAVAPSALKADGPSLNEAALREGLMRWNRKDAPDEKTLADAEQSAIKDKKGVWSGT